MKENGANVLLGIIFVIFGFIFAFAPNEAFGSIILVAGLIIVFFAIIKLITLLRMKDSIVSYSITSSVVSLIFGIVLVIYRDATVKLLVELIGIWFLISGISSLILAIKSGLSGNYILKPISKIIIGLISFILPMVSVSITGIIIGAILILAGISIFTTKREDEVIYKVKVKK